MITLRRGDERGVSHRSWLDSRHTFSFGEYRDPGHTGFRCLRVINEDRIAPSGGFPDHPHQDMEIVTYLVSGQLEHRDSTGGGSVIAPGDIQRMSAGTGIVHSEFNPSDAEPVHLLQIWIETARPGMAPGYEEAAFRDRVAPGRPTVILSGTGRDGAVTIHQDVEMLRLEQAAGDTYRHRVAPGRHCWLQVVSGAITVDGTAAAAGDGLAVSDEREFTVTANAPSEWLLLDLP